MLLVLKVRKLLFQHNKLWNISFHVLKSYTNPAAKHLREEGRVNRGLDDSRIDGEDGEDDTGQKDEGELVDVFHADEHHEGHEGEDDGAVHAHVVQQRCLSLRALQALHLKDGCPRYDVDLHRGSGSECSMREKKREGERGRECVRKRVRERQREITG